MDVASHVFTFIVNLRRLQRFQKSKMEPGDQTLYLAPFKNNKWGDYYYISDVSVISSSFGLMR